MPEKKPIYLVEVADSYDLASIFVRFQEYYESPKFRGQIFTREEFMDWYEKEHGGDFAYFRDWSGFNIPSYTLVPFREGKFDPLSQKERQFLELFRTTSEPFYIIGVSKPLNPSTVKHELVHGLYYTDPDYREKVGRALETLDTAHFKRVLKKTGGYNPAVWDDEINAYSLAGADDVVSPFGNRKVKRALDQLFVEHFGFSLEKMRGEEALEMVHRIDFDPSR